MNSTLSTQIDSETKIAFTHVCEEIGLTPSQAIKVFAQAVVNYGGIPFELKQKQPNELTIQAMRELDAGQGHRVNSVTELFKECNVDLNNA